MPWLHFGYRAASLNGVSYAKLQQTMKVWRVAACWSNMVKHGQTMSIGPFFIILLRQISSHVVFTQVDDCRCVAVRCSGGIPASLWDEPPTCRFNSTRTRAAAPQGEGADCRDSETLRLVNFPNIFTVNPQNAAMNREQMGTISAALEPEAAVKAAVGRPWTCRSNSGKKGQTYVGPKTNLKWCMFLCVRLRNNMKQSIICVLPAFSVCVCACVIPSIDIAVFWSLKNVNKGRTWCFRM